MASWMFVVFPLFWLLCCEHQCMQSLVWTILVSPGYMPSCGNCYHAVASCFNISGAPDCFSEGTASFQNSPRKRVSCSSFSTSSPYCLFYSYSLLMGVQWYLTVVLVCILTSCLVEHLFMCLPAIVTSVQILCPFFS